jgi:hypothetical protein
VNQRQIVVESGTKKEDLNTHVINLHLEHDLNPEILILPVKSQTTIEPTEIHFRLWT